MNMKVEEGSRKKDDTLVGCIQDVDWGIAAPKESTR